MSHSLNAVPCAGMMSQYSSGWQPSVNKGLPEMLLWKSATVRGFFLPHHTRHYKRHLAALTNQWLQGRLHVSLDPSRFMCAASTTISSPWPESMGDLMHHWNKPLCLHQWLLYLHLSTFR